MVVASTGVLGGEVESSFFKLRFSGVASSGAESTSRSDSGELGARCLCGDSTKGRQNDEFFSLGLLGDDSDPVSWSVSAAILCLFIPNKKNETENKQT